MSMSCGLRTVILIAVFAALLVGVGCGGGSEEKSDGEDSSKNSATRAIQPDAQARAESMVLQLTDFPTDWRASTPEDDEGGDEFRKCIGADFSDLTIVGEQDSQDFAMGDDDTKVSSSATIMKSAEEAQSGSADVITGMSGPAVADCVMKIFEDALKKEDSGEKYKVGDVEVGELNFQHPTGVEEARAFQIELPVEVQSISVTVTLDFVLLRQGDALATISTEDQSGALDSDLRDQLVQDVASRMSGTPTQPSTETSPSA